MTNPLLQLKELGQSVWYDNIDRSQLASGQFQRMLDEDGVVGVTANPTIFEMSISAGHAYDEQIDQLIRERKGTNVSYELLIIKDISRMASVASFFVSRVDTLVDKMLEDKIKATSDSAEQQKLKSLEGKAAIANARIVYQEFKRFFNSPRFEKLKQNGAHVQRPLWASTSTKNPAYRDVLYAEELIGPDTVDTMPLETIENFRDHGQVRLSIEDNLEEAHQVFDALEKIGIHYDQVTKQLQDEGVQKFADSFHTLFEGIAEKRKAIETQQVKS